MWVLLEDRGRMGYDAPLSIRGGLGNDRFKAEALKTQPVFPEEV